jgi:hypothetical protein
MKIYDSNLGGTAAAGTQRNQETQQTVRTDSTRSSQVTGAGGDRFEFSGTLGRLSRAISTGESDRASRVQALASQYQAGLYSPNSAATSRAMIGDALSSGLN